MNGRYLLDTNAVIALLQNNPTLLTQLEAAEWVAISIVTYLEFLSFSNLDRHDRALFLEFAARIDVLDLKIEQTSLIDRILELRSQNRLKLPDAIIAATSIEYDATLLTRDQQLLNQLNLTCQDF
jgi:predicted nucleic acid-binding protein